jgi:putative membrane protein
VKSKGIQFLQRWLVTTVAVLVAANTVHGIHYTGLPALLVASLVLGLVNAFVRPVLLLVSISFVVATLGFGVLVINALLLWGVGSLVTGFRVDGFWPAFWGGLVISVVSLFANLFVGRGPRIAVGNGRRGGNDGPGATGGGPIIDV